MEIMNYSKGTGVLENWLIEESRFDPGFLGKCESIFSQGNGYLGLRNALEESYIGETRDLLVTGTFNRFDTVEATELPNFPDLTQIALFVNEKRFSMTEGKTENYSRVLNLKSGETIRTLIWHADDHTAVELRFRRMVSMDNEHVIGNTVEIIPLSENITLKIVSWIDGTMTNGGSQHFSGGVKRVCDPGILQYAARTTQSDVLAVVQTAHRLSLNNLLCEAQQPRLISARRKIGCEYNITLGKHDTLCFEKISAVHSTRDLCYAAMNQEEAESRVLHDSLACIKQAAGEGYDRLLAKSVARWAEIWNEQGITIHSENGYDQLAIRFALYHLNCMVKKDDDRVGIGAKGLSGEGYQGHSFWDTELFLLPYYMMTQPDTAKTLLGYRYRTLDTARKKAKETGYEGARYPWESAWINECDATPLWSGFDLITGKPIKCLTGEIELHITADIAYAIARYQTVTGDEEFMERCGYEILIETARFWNSRLEWQEEKQQYAINNVIGPDEYKVRVGNNAYTNYMVRFNLEESAKQLNFLKKEKPAVYRRLGELTDLNALYDSIMEKLPLLYLPQPDPKTGIIPQFDGYFDLQEIPLEKYKEASFVEAIFQDYSVEQVEKMKVAKQADVVELLYRLGNLFSAEIKQKNYFYYEQRTVHDSSLSRAIHGILACDLGMTEEAYALFVRAASTDLGPAMRSSDAGIHSANMGGVWQSVVMGFGGIRVDCGELHINPRLPKQWEKLAYPIVWKGIPLVITITQEQVTIVNQGTPITIWYREHPIKVGTGRTVLQ